jgi:hypothetical protein
MYSMYSCLPPLTVNCWSFTLLITITTCFEYIVTWHTLFEANFKLLTRVRMMLKFLKAVNCVSHSWICGDKQMFSLLVEEPMYLPHAEVIPQCRRIIGDNQVHCTTGPESCKVI